MILRFGIRYSAVRLEMYPFTAKRFTFTKMSCAGTGTTEESISGSKGRWESTPIPIPTPTPMETRTGHRGHSAAFSLQPIAFVLSEPWTHRVPDPGPRTAKRVRPHRLIRPSALLRIIQEYIFDIDRLGPFIDPNVHREHPRSVLESDDAQLCR